MVQRTTKEALKYFFAEHLRVLKNVCILKKMGNMMLMKILQLFDSDNKGLEPIWNLAGLADLLQQLRYYTEF